MPGEALSPSQAVTFLGCSAKYRFKHILSLPDPAAGGAVRGKAVHKAVEHYLRAKMAGVTLDVETVTGEWDQIWDAASEGAEFNAQENVEELKASGARHRGHHQRAPHHRRQDLIWQTVQGLRRPCFSACDLHRALGR
jgi:hypothetical protein